MAGTQTFEFVVLPQLRSEPEPEPKLLKLAEKFLEFRLHALLNAADAFASTYEAEKRDGIPRALLRLTNSKAVHFVALRTAQKADDTTNSGDEFERILASDWVGINVLLGPEEDDELSVIPSANLDPFPRMTATPASTPLVHRPAQPGELHFHINGMYVDASTRGGGVGRKLMDAALDRAKAEAASAKLALRVTLSVYEHNVAAIKLYKNSGFKVLRTEKSRSKPGSMAIHMDITVAGPK